MNQRRKTFLVFVSAAILSFVLASAGHRITYSLLMGSYDSYKDDYVLISIIETLLVLCNFSF
jgi:hypothetical protein